MFSYFQIHFCSEIPFSFTSLSLSVPSLFPSLYIPDDCIAVPAFPLTFSATSQLPSSFGLIYFPPRKQCCTCLDVVAHLTRIESSHGRTQICIQDALRPFKHDFSHLRAAGAFAKLLVLVNKARRVVCSFFFVDFNLWTKLRGALLEFFSHQFVSTVSYPVGLPWFQRVAAFTPTFRSTLTTVKLDATASFQRLQYPSRTFLGSGINQLKRRS
ncbi:hypothetical protein K438DRAFT_247854 [Mycena galopus ATCC 62051]|nr:hypothetical protein K438DRAFT_247854 [Mycena galopus ATCC 62051]